MMDTSAVKGIAMLSMCKTGSLDEQDWITGRLDEAVFSWSDKE